MKFITVNGSITDKQLLARHRTVAIGHCANCFCAMGSGVAAAIRKDMFYAVEADNTTVSGNPKKGGTFTIGTPERLFNKDFTECTPYIFNLYGQYSMGTQQRQVNYEWIYKALEGMKEGVLAAEKSLDVLSDGVWTIGFPARMGCGLAGGNWKIVYTMIEEVFGGTDFNHQVVIYDIGF